MVNDRFAQAHPTTQLAPKYYILNQCSTGYRPHAFCTPYYRPAGAILRSKTENELFHTNTIFEIVQMLYNVWNLEITTNLKFNNKSWKTLKKNLEYAFSRKIVFFQVT